MKTNYVLIDYENVQPEVMAGLCEEHFKVLVFVGENQSKVTFEVASVLQRMGSRAEYIKISGSGKNALDFHIAYYLGQIALREPEAFFHIISKDSGFDPLIQHLKAHKICACRSNDVVEIPILKTATAKTPADRIAVVIEDLKRRKASKPRALKTLTSTVSAIFQKQLSEQQVDAIVATLEQQGVLSINGTKVSYSLPD